LGQIEDERALPDLERVVLEDTVWDVAEAARDAVAGIRQRMRME